MVSKWASVTLASSRASHDNFSAVAVWLVEPDAGEELPFEEA